jgi:hypothetical protein
MSTELHDPRALRLPFVITSRELCPLTLYYNAVAVGGDKLQGIITTCNRSNRAFLPYDVTTFLSNRAF